MFYKNWLFFMKYLLCIIWNINLRNMENCYLYNCIISMSNLCRWVSDICKKNVFNCFINYCSVKIFWNENVNFKDVLVLWLFV